jgi:hypothetical protein
VNTTLTSLVAFASTLAAALVGIALRARLPAHHLDGDSKDAVKLVIGLIATMTALVLGLLTSSAHSAYDQQVSELQQLGVHLTDIDRILAHFGPEAAPQRELLRRIVAEDIARVWPSNGAGGAPPTIPIAVRQAGQGLFDGIASLTAKTELQRLGQSRALQLLTSVSETRRLLSEQASSAVSPALVFVLIAWLTLLFFGFGLFARFNATVFAAFLVGAASVAASLFLILEMSQPYRGWIQVSSAPLRNALAQMGQ